MTTTKRVLLWSLGVFGLLYVIGFAVEVADDEVSPLEWILATGFLCSMATIGVAIVRDK